MPALDSNTQEHSAQRIMGETRAGRMALFDALPPKVQEIMTVLHHDWAVAPVSAALHKGVPVGYVIQLCIDNDIGLTKKTGPEKWGPGHPGVSDAYRHYQRLDRTLRKRPPRTRRNIRRGAC